MDNNPVPPTPTPHGLIVPNRTELLANIKIDKSITVPLGGLNPYNPYFSTIGEQFKRLLIDHALLNKDQAILDIGCGTGRLANQLTNFLTGSYSGFDVHPHFIDYCKTTYQATNFNFQAIDIIHDEYNPNGTIDASTFVFPYQANSFDLVIAIAVFNHFKLEWIIQYIREISRVLKPRGVFFGTILLLNQQSIDFINTRIQPPYQFSHRTPESWHDFETRPLFNVAHPEDVLRRVFIKSNLMIREPIRYGEWCRSKVALAGPDIIVARKNGWR